eukprot:Gb_02108 [translate_table: standard]
MFSEGIGQNDHRHIMKGKPDVGMLIVKVEGHAYRIGMGDGATSSMVSGQNDVELDFNAIQLRDTEMAQNLYRACVEMGDKNPIVSIYDQGAEGNCIVVKKIIYRKGEEIAIRSIVVGDKNMSVLEIWGAEYRGAGCNTDKAAESPMTIIGMISGNGRVVLINSLTTEHCASNSLPSPLPAVDLNLLRRSGCAAADGEQPIKGLLNSKAMAKLAVVEALTNLVWTNVL